MARWARLERPLRRLGLADAAAVVEHLDGDVVADVDVEVGTRCPGVAGDVGQCLADDVDQLVDDRIGDGSVDRSGEADVRFEAERRRDLGDDVGDPLARSARRLGLAQLVDRESDRPDDLVDVVDRLGDPARPARVW